MKQGDIHISMTEFVNFVNSSGMSKITVVANAKARHLEEDGNPYDYWKDFKDKLKTILRSKGNKEDLLELLEEVRDDVRDNYQLMINGFLKFWKPTRMKWFNPIKRIVHYGGLKMIINPEIGIEWQGSKYMVKLFLKANEYLDKRHADIILAMMENELREKVDEGVRFAILDVRRGKIFSYANDNPRLLVLLRAESRSFADIWNGL